MRRGPFSLLILLICLASLGSCVYRVMAFRTAAPLTAVQANRSWRMRDPVPESASSVRMFTQGAAKSFDYALRFCAPRSSCEAFAWSIVARDPAAWTAAVIRIDPDYPEPPHAYFRSLALDWFDVHSISNGVRLDYDWRKGESGGSIHECIWIDYERNIVYQQAAD